MPRAANPSPVATRLPDSPANLFVGTSGWAYTTWKPGFYPKGVAAKAFLPYYASQLTSVEVNYTFRMLPTTTQLQGWLDAVPSGFRFSFKAPQRITHFARLRECESSLAEFLAALELARLAGKLGAVLFQLPPNFAADRERLAAFLDVPCLRAENSPALAFEFRHASWFAEPVLHLLREQNVALCVAESEDLQTPDVRTATHSYYRLRCPGGYSAERLEAMAPKFASHSRKGATFVYFKHEAEPTGALNARSMLAHAARIASLEPDSPGDGDLQ